MILHLPPQMRRALTAAAVLGAVVFGLSSAAMAQASAQPAPATKPVPAAKATPSQDPVEARIKSLHAALKITAAQEPLWQAVADVMRDNAKATGALIEQREANAKTMTAVDDLHAYEAIADAHAAGVKKLTAVFEPLYAALSDAQKKSADAMFRHREHPSHAKKPG